MSLDINAVERTLRADAAHKAVATADTYGWTELRSGVYLDSAERMTSLGHDAQDAPYWMTTSDSEPPTPIWGSNDERLRGMVDVDRELTQAALAIDAKDRKARETTREPARELAGVVEAMEKQSRGRAM
jgi:hypothetical protein